MKNYFMWCPLELLSLFSKNEMALTLDEKKQTIEIARAKKEIKLSFIFVFVFFLWNFSNKILNLKSEKLKSIIKMKRKRKHIISAWMNIWFDLIFEIDFLFQ